MKKHVEHLKPGQNLAITHPLDTEDVLVQVYDQDGEAIFPDIKVTGADQVTVSGDGGSPDEMWKVVIIG